MKKLSVLLVIGLFCIPMMVYGFTKTGLPSVISNSISKGYHAIVTFASRSQDRSTSLIQPHISQIDAPSQNPFFKEPFGAKGIVASINPDNKLLVLKEASYFDPATRTMTKTDLTIFFNEITTFYTDMVENGDFHSLNVGDTIICNGPVDYQTKEMKFAYDIYMGKFIHDNAQASLSFTAPIKNFIRSEGSFSFDYPGTDGRFFTLRVSITDMTQVFTISKSSPKPSRSPEENKIPLFVKDGTLMSGVFIINQDLTAVANIVNFFEN